MDGSANPVSALVARVVDFPCADFVWVAGGDDLARVVVLAIFDFSLVQYGRKKTQSEADFVPLFGGSGLFAAPALLTDFAGTNLSSGGDSVRWGDGRGVFFGEGRDL